METCVIVWYMYCMSCMNNKYHMLYNLYIIGADLNTCDFAGNTALHAATEAGNHLCVNFLLSFGANCKVQNIYGNTPSDIAKALQNMR